MVGSNEDLDSAKKQMLRELVFSKMPSRMTLMEHHFRGTKKAILDPRGPKEGRISGSRDSADDGDH